ncbi:hypothetical protein AB0O68_21075 [Streptomyces sp. NPDC087512]|uniref:hypothetical protein n=1 Tax=Streptomyces sp. NPDC087512 TaxID=3155059 RepID=UPI0034127E66
MPRTQQFHLDVDSHSITVQTRHAAHESELLVDGKVVGYQRIRHRKDAIVLRAELPGDPPRPFEVTLRTDGSAERATTCVLEIDGHRHPMAGMPMDRSSETTLHTGARPSPRSARRLLDSLVQRTHRQ